MDTSKRSNLTAAIRAMTRATRGVLVEAVESRRLMAAVNGVVFADANGNGQRDAVETGLSGQTVYADYNYDGKLSAGEPSVAATANGSYTLTTALKPFALRTLLTSGQTQTSPANNGTFFYEVHSGVLVGYGTTFGVKVGTVTPPPTTTTISGYVYLDANENDIRDADETGAAAGYQGLYEVPQVVLDLNDNGKYDAGTGEQIVSVDQATGAYQLNNVPTLGTRSVFVVYDTSVFRPINPSGYGPDGVAHILVGNVPSPGVNFGLTDAGGTIGADASTIDRNNDGFPDDGTAPGWVDLDRDGVLDANEPILTWGDTPFTPGPYPQRHLGSVTLPFGSYRIAVDGYVRDGVAEAYTEVTISAVKPSDYEFITVPHQQPIGTTIFASVTNDATKNGIGGQTIFADYNYNGVLDAGEDSAVTTNFGSATLRVQGKPFQLVLRPASGYAQSSPANKGVYYYELKNNEPVGYGSTFGVVSTVTSVQTGGIIAFVTSTAFDSKPSLVADVQPQAYYYYFKDERAVWVDLNHNNTLDADEPKFTWQFNPTLDPDVPNLTVDGLPLGDYTVAIGKGNGIGTTAELTRPVTIDAHVNVLGTNLATLDVAVDPLSPVIVGRLFYDPNANGTPDAGEPGLNLYTPNSGNANVFADYNFNGQKDVDEPYAISRSDNPEGFSSLNGIYVLEPQIGRAFQIAGSGRLQYYGGRLITQSTPSPLYKTAVGDPTRSLDIGFSDRASPPITPTTPISGLIFVDADGNGRFDPLVDRTVGGSDGVFADTNYNGVLDSNEARAYVNSIDGQPRYTLNAPIASFALRSFATNSVYFYEVRDGKLVGYGADFILPA